jgi:hypothetical protein
MSAKLFGNPITIELETGQNLQIVIKVKKSKFNMMASFVRKFASAFPKGILLLALFFQTSKY